MSGKYWLVAAAAAVWLGQASTASATPFTGSLATSGGIDGQGGWQNDGDLTFSWSVDNTGSAWTYDYLISEFANAENPKFVERLLVEVSSGFLDSDYTWLAGPTPTLGTFSSVDFAGIPSLFKALHWEQAGASTMHVQFSTSRAPVWGDFYAGDGGAHAVNRGFTASDTDPSDLAANGSIDNHILRPDTATIVPPVDPPVDPPVNAVPEPTSMLLLGTGLVALVRRHVRK